MNLIIFGPQGSGKGTQAKILSEKLKIPHISSGYIFRENINNQTKLGKKAKEYIDQGHLVPDKLTVELIKERLNQADCKPGFILDGYPRTLAQAQALDQIVKIAKALEVWISDKESIMRISGRRTCSGCDTVFHLKFNSPAKENICDKCGGQLFIRDDDQEEVIKKRLELYHQQTEPLINYYKTQNKLIKIDGQPPIPEVTKEIFKKLDIR